jgi:hypothetical protein
MVHRDALHFAVWPCVSPPTDRHIMDKSIRYRRSSRISVNQLRTVGGHCLFLGKGPRKSTIESKISPFGWYRRRDRLVLARTVTTRS